MRALSLGVRNDTSGFGALGRTSSQRGVVSVSSSFLIRNPRGRVAELFRSGLCVLKSGVGCGRIKSCGRMDGNGTSGLGGGSGGSDGGARNDMRAVRKAGDGGGRDGIGGGTSPLTGLMGAASGGLSGNGGRGGNGGSI
jgi:hypothetical protein